jgi:hypothetical protein
MVAARDPVAPPASPSPSFVKKGDGRKATPAPASRGQESCPQAKKAASKRIGLDEGTNVDQRDQNAVTSPAGSTPSATISRCKIPAIAIGAPAIASTPHVGSRRAAVFSLPSDERQEVGVDGLDLGRRHAVREAAVRLVRALPQQLRGQGGGVRIRHDLIVLPVHHQDGYADLPQVPRARRNRTALDWRRAAPGVRRRRLSASRRGCSQSSPSGGGTALRMAAFATRLSP